MKLQSRQILQNISEAREGLQSLEGKLASGEIIDENLLEIDIQHAFHHLNFAWNIRHVAPERYANCSDIEFSEWGRFPGDLDLMMSSGEIDSASLENAQETLNQCGALRIAVVENIERLKRDFPGWMPDTDGRLTTFNMMRSQVNSIGLGLFFIKRHLLDLNWWNTNLPDNYTAEEAIQLLERFDMNLKIGFTLQFFGTFEHGIRTLLFNLDPDACNQARSPFDTVLNCLVDRLAGNYNDELPHIDLFRVLRNTQHNNGVHRPQNGKDKSFDFEGQKCNFVMGKAVDFATFKFIFSLCTRTAQTFEKFVRDDAIRTLSFCARPPKEGAN